MKIKTKINKIRYEHRYKHHEIIIELPENIQTSDIVRSLKIKDSDYTIEIKENRKGRSLDANAYLWSLLTELGKAIHKSSIELYKYYIRNYGVANELLCKQEATSRFIENWGNNGIGYFAESEPYKQGFDYVRAYYGSHNYNSKEFSILLDAVVGDCQDFGIQTLEEERTKQLLNEIDNNRLK